MWVCVKVCGCAHVLVHVCVYDGACVYKYVLHVHVCVYVLCRYVRGTIHVLKSVIKFTCESARMVMCCRGCSNWRNRRILLYADSC